MFFVLQFREIDGRMDRSTRTTNQISGPTARERLDAEIAETLAVFAESRARYPEAAAAQAEADRERRSAA
jgi:hypothetical protein